MHIHFSTERLLQARYLLFTTRSTQLGLFQHDDFLVLPEKNVASTQIVYLPRLPFSIQYWELLSYQHDYRIQASFPQALLVEAEHLLQDSNFFCNAVPTDWQTAVHSLLGQLTLVLSERVLSTIAEIIIVPTIFGSCGSFSHTAINAKLQLICTARIDLPISNLLETITKGILATTQAAYSDIGTEHYVNREGTAAVLKLYIEYIGGKQVSLHAKKLDYKSYLASTKYLTELGLQPKQLIDFDRFYLTLTHAELLFCKALAVKPCIVVSVDEIARSLWQDTTEKFSLYAITDLGQSVRAKLKQFGIQREVLHTIRKHGYILIL